MAHASSDENAINLATIQKTDKLCCEVLDKCTSSALYKYAQGKWEKCNCDGVFLLYRRSVPPLYGFIVLNKRSTQNHVQYITKAMGLQLQPPFLLYKAKAEAEEIHGMWFFTQRDCQRIAAMVGQLVVSLGGEPLRVASTAKGKAAAVASTEKQQQQQPLQPQQQKLQAAPVAAPAGAEVAQSIMQMLSRAQNDFQHRSGGGQQQQPKVISVDSLFGGVQQSQQQQQQMQASPGASSAINGAQPSQQPQPQRDQYAEMSFQIKEHLGLITGPQKPQQQQQPPLPPPPQQQQQQQERRSREASCSQADDEEEEFLLTPGMLECAADQLLADCPQPAASAMQSPPRLQPPPSQQPPPQQQQPPRPAAQQQKPHQLQPQQQPARAAGDIPALTREQLRESLVYLLENDDAFLSSLHGAYVASLQRRLSSA